MPHRWKMPLFAIMLIAIGAAHAQSTKTTRIVVAFPPGGPVDLVGRVLAEQLGKELGETVIIDNKPGANGGIAAQFVARAQPDGATLWLTSVGAAAINPSLYDNLPYDMQRDFAPVSVVVDNVEVLVVNPKDASNTAAEFIAASKARKEPTPMASSGIGSIPHLAIEQLADATKANLLHIPYKGAAPALADVMGGQVAGFFGDIPGLIGFVQGGKLKAIGIAADRRHPLLPDVRTLVEQGISGVDSNNWYALFVPARTPSATVEALNAAVRRALATPGVRDKLMATGTDPAPTSPQDLSALVKRDTEKWAKLIKAKGIQGQ
jgi:tripartite-type tricarboxylate transporter receptor subunit TctC